MLDLYSTAALTAPSPRLKGTWNLTGPTENPFRQSLLCSPPSRSKPHRSPTPSYTSLKARSHPEPSLSSSLPHFGKPFRLYLQVIAEFFPSRHLHDHYPSPHPSHCHLLPVITTLMWSLCFQSCLPYSPEVTFELNKPDLVTCPLKTLQSCPQNNSGSKFPGAQGLA